jgi:hypothetical protein
MNEKDEKEVREKIEELNWIMSQMREGLQKIRESKEENETTKVI